jgi:hypothetical protein
MPQQSRKMVSSRQNIQNSLLSFFFFFFLFSFFPRNQIWLGSKKRGKNANNSGGGIAILQIGSLVNVDDHTVAI